MIAEGIKNLRLSERWPPVAMQGAPLEDPMATAFLVSRFSIAIKVKNDLTTSSASCSDYRSTRSTSPHGALASLRGRRVAASRWGKKDGAVQSFGRPYRRDGRLCGHFELTPAIVPVRTYFCRGRTVLFCQLCSALCPRRDGVAPAKVSAIDPHALKNDGDSPGERDDSAAHPPALRHPASPRLSARTISRCG